MKIIKTTEKSLTKNLIFQLGALICLMLIVVFLFSFFNAKKEIAIVFDAEMSKSAQLVYGIVRDNHFIKIKENLDSKLNQKLLNRYSYEIHLQAWKGNSLIYNSGEKIQAPIPSAEGFDDVLLNNEEWRSFALFDRNSQIKILVLEKNHIRKELVSEVAFSMLAPFISCLLFLMLIIISVVKKQLSPLEALAQKITDIPTSNLKKFTSPQLPVELKPFLESFQNLLKRLDESIESEKRFTDYAAHELNTPLTAIKIQAQILVRNSTSEQQKEQLDDLLAAVNRTAHLVDQLLTLSRIAADDRNFEKENLCLSAVAEEQIANFMQNYHNSQSIEIAEAQNHKIEFFCEEAAKFATINGNKFYLAILLKNLLDNAWKYSFGGDKIVVKLSKKSANLQLKISNFGDEVSHTDCKKIFDNFYRSNRSKSTRNISGSGLGLAIAKKIVELHRGAIGFQSSKSKIDEFLSTTKSTKSSPSSILIFINSVEIELPLSSN